jgi:hypothetical protein
VKDGSGNPFMKRSAIKDCNAQPDPQFLRRGTPKIKDKEPGFTDVEAAEIHSRCEAWGSGIKKLGWLGNIL